MQKASLNKVVKGSEVVYKLSNYPEIRAVDMESGEVGFSLTDVYKLLGHLGYYSENTRSGANRMKSPVARENSIKTGKLCIYVTLEQLYDSYIVLDKAINILEQITSKHKDLYNETTKSSSSLEKQLEEERRKYKALETAYNVLLQAMTDSGLF